MTFREENEQFNTERNLLMTFRQENERNVTFTLEFHLFLDQRLEGGTEYSSGRLELGQGWVPFYYN